MDWVRGMISAQCTVTAEKVQASIPSGFVCFASLTRRFQCGSEFDAQKKNSRPTLASSVHYFAAFEKKKTAPVVSGSIRPLV